MHVMDERCANLDVHQRTVVTCVLAPDGQETPTFGTTTADMRSSPMAGGV
jgi:hypothetical protein